jgi:acyl carrier protein
MEKEQVKKELAELISEVMPELGEIDLKKDIVSEYGINSVSIIRLIVSVESKFGVSFTDYELDLGAYRTFEQLADVVVKKLDEE